MKITQTILQKTFRVEHHGKVYYVDYVNSDGQALILLNRDNWQIYDENHEELNIYLWKDSNKKEKKKIEMNLCLAEKLISFCILKFN
ncbi:hypothetical protein FJZ18_00510 [Candidatus Pacearchaeota archaeon]|nr:hypothetical protein [Candidatus Pacearchaeota archaeon]